MLQQSAEGPHQLAVRLVEAAVADFVALVGSSARGLGMESRYELQADLCGPVQNRSSSAP